MRYLITTMEAKKVEERYLALIASSEKDKVYTLQEIREMLKASNLPFSLHVLCSYNMYGLIEKKQNLFRFPETPASLEDIKKCFTHFRAEFKRRNSGNAIDVWVDTMIENPVDEWIKARQKAELTTKCIQYLKAQGYVIYKPC